MQPLKVTWRFRSPVVVAEHPVHLDSLLARSTVDAALARNEEDAFAAQEQLPLERHGEVWKASALMFMPIGTPVLVPMTRRYDVHSLAIEQGVRYEGKKNKFPRGTGKFKGYDLRVSCRWIEKAEAWCVGNKDMVAELLSSITAIGKLVRLGYGEISECEISVAPQEEAEMWQVRNLPITETGNPAACYAPSVQTLRPPYWDKLQLQEVLCPIAIKNRPKMIMFG